MKIKDKRFMAILMSSLIFLSSLTISGCSSDKTEEQNENITTSFSDADSESLVVKRDTNYETIVNETTVDAETIKNIKLEKYDNDFGKKTYYVHSNGNRTILSQNDYVENYDLEAEYTSFSSFESIVFMIIDNKDGTLTCETVSFDDMAEMSNRDEIEFYIINEDSPVDAFIPLIRVNNDKGISKKLNN